MSVKNKRMNKINKKENSDSEGNSSNEENKEIKKLESQVQKVKNTVEAMVNLLKTKNTTQFKTNAKIDLRSPLGVDSKNNWIYMYSINEALQLVPISVKEIR